LPNTLNVVTRTSQAPPVGLLAVPAIDALGEVPVVLCASYAYAAKPACTCPGRVPGGCVSSEQSERNKPVNVWI
jgi:hypothetical protein